MLFPPSRQARALVLAVASTLTVLSPSNFLFFLVPALVAVWPGFQLKGTTTENGDAIATEHDLEAQTGVTQSGVALYTSSGQSSAESASSGHLLKHHAKAMLKMHTSKKTSSPALDGFLYHADGVVGYVYQDTVFIQQAPERVSSSNGLDEAASQDGNNDWNPSSAAEGFIYHALVPLDWPQKTVAEAGLRNLGGLFLVGVQRGSRFLAAVGPNFGILHGDLLGFSGTTDNFPEFCKCKGLYSLGDCIDEGLASFISHDFLFSVTEQVIVRSKSWLVGKTAKEVGFRARYGASIVSISRVGELLPFTNCGNVKFKAGDALVLLKSDAFDWCALETKRDIRIPSVYNQVL